MSQLLAVEQNPGSSLEAFICFAACFGYCQSSLSPVCSLQKCVCTAFFWKGSQWKYLPFRLLQPLLKKKKKLLKIWFSHFSNNNGSLIHKKNLNNWLKWVFFRRSSACLIFYSSQHIFSPLWDLTRIKNIFRLWLLPKEGLKAFGALLRPCIWHGRRAHLNQQEGDGSSGRSYKAAADDCGASTQHSLCFWS